MPKTAPTDCFCVAGRHGAPGSACAACPAGGDCCSCPEIYTAAPKLKGKVAVGNGTLDRYDVALVLKNFKAHGRACHSCRSGPAAPIAKPGWFAATAKPGVFVPCVPADACLGGPASTCAAGFAGFRCGQCAKDYYRLDGGCNQCPKTPLYLMLLAGAFTLFWCLYMLNAVSRWFRSGALAIFFDWAQTTALFAGFAVGWPDTLKGLNALMSSMMFNVEFFAPEVWQRTP